MDREIEKQRLYRYKILAMAFSYPDDEFLNFFSLSPSDREVVASDYDRLFRANEIWLYSTEYIAKNEFQRANALSDIRGFYQAFGLDIDTERPDALSCEFEFMHYLIFKRELALTKDIEGNREKAFICLDAQRKFFSEYLYPSAKKISEAIINKTSNGSFYKDSANQMLEFLESEDNYFERFK